MLPVPVAGDFNILKPSTNEHVGCRVFKEVALKIRTVLLVLRNSCVS
jgi:hypothetical protein